MTKNNVHIFLWISIAAVPFLYNKGEALSAVQHVYHFTKLDVPLECPFFEGQLIVWQENEIDEIIAINGTIFSKNAKYNNFDVLNEGNKSTLLIQDAEMEDEGIYICQNQEGELSSFWVHMQNQPSLSIYINGTEIDAFIDLDEKDHILIECNSTGADPPVSVSLAVDEVPLISEITVMDNDTHTAYVSTHWTVLRSHREIDCIDHGQKYSTYERSIELNVMYSPNCTLTVEDETTQNAEYFNCTCDANPTSTKYTFAVDGKIVQESVMNILLKEDNLPDDARNVTCWGHNGKVGFSKPAVYYITIENDNGLPGFAIALIVIAVLVLLAGAIGAIVYKRKYTDLGFQQVEINELS